MTQNYSTLTYKLTIERATEHVFSDRNNNVLSQIWQMYIIHASLTEGVYLNISGEKNLEDTLQAFGASQNIRAIPLQTEHSLEHARQTFKASKQSEGHVPETKTLSTPVRR